MSPRVSGRARRAGGAVLAAALVSGLSGYAVLVLVARHLTPQENADFLVFWGLLFGVCGVLIGLMNEVTRAVFSQAGSPRAPGVRAVPAATGVGLALVLLLSLASPWWGPATFRASWPGLVVAVASGAALFVVHACMTGAAAGQREWTSYAALVSVESANRVLLVGLAVLCGAAVPGLAWAVAGAAGTWAVFVACSPGMRHLWTIRADVPLTGLLHRAATACATSGASAAFLVAFPVLLRLTTGDEEFASSAPLVLAVSLTRAPLLVPLGAFQNVVITQVIARGPRALAVPVVMLAAGAVAGTVGAAVVGPAGLRLIHPSYNVSPNVFALLTVAAGLVALQTLAASAVLGLDRHGEYLAGWVVTSLTAVLALTGSGSLETRILTALLLGPVLGGLVHVFSALRPRRRRPVRHD